jgi:hypothetical protein
MGIIINNHFKLTQILFLIYKSFTNKDFKLMKKKKLLKIISKIKWILSQYNKKLKQKYLLLRIYLRKIYLRIYLKN